MTHKKAHMKNWTILATAALIACSSSREPAVSHEGTTLTDCFTPVPAGSIVGFGINAQPRQWGSDGRAIKPALDLLVNDLGANFFRVELNNGQTDWETSNDDGDPNSFNWQSFDAYFSSPAFADTWDYIRYLNQLGVAHVELAQHGGIPPWMGTNTPPAGSTQTSYPGPADGRAYVLTPALEDEFVETCIAVLLYARTRAPQPRPHFDLFSPWNEPEFSGEGEGIDIPTAQRARVLNKLVTRMNALPDLAGVQLVVGEDGSEPGMIETRGAVQGDSVVMARTAATSFHRYSDADVWTQWNNASPPAWLTEFNATGTGSNCFATSWTQALQATGNLISALQNGVTAGLGWSDTDAPHSHQNNTWQTWGLLATVSNGNTGTQLCNAFNDQQPSDAILDAMTYTPKPTYVALRHGFRYIRPNATPITMSATGGVLAVAYKNADGTVAVFGRASGGSSTVTLTMTNPPVYLTPRVSTATSTDVVGNAVPLTNGQGVFSFPSSSVFTLLSSPGSGGSGGTGGMGGNAGAAGASAGMSGSGAAGNGGVSGSSAASGNGGQSGSSGADQGGMSGSGGASGAGGVAAGAAGVSGGQGGAGAGGQSAGASGASASGQAGSGGTAGLPGLVAAWEFDEATGTTTADASGHGHTGTIASGVTWVTSGCKFGACLSFPGTSGKNVTVPDANDLDLGANFTVMAWVLPTTTSGWRPVLIKENASSTEAYLLYSNPSNQGAYFTDSNGAEWSTTGTGNVSTSQWSHVAMTKNGTTLSYWVNGSVVGSTTVSSLAVKTSTGILAIGGHTFWTGEWFSGKLDSVRCYAAALTSSQIAQAMGGSL